MIFESICNAPHTLIGGTTGSGKSVLMNGIIKELFERGEQVVLIDPKKVELSIYANTENCVAYSDSLNDIVNVLNAVSELINDRYDRMKLKRIRMTDEPHLFVIVDELADLMISDKAREVKRLLQRILQIGRAAGVHIIAATQSPARKVIPAELVLNFTDRVALRCLSAIESRQVINKAGAELLPKYGHAIYMNGDGYREVSIPFVSTEEAELIADAHAKIEEVPEVKPVSDYKRTSLYVSFALACGLAFFPSVLSYMGIACICFYMYRNRQYV